MADTAATSLKRQDIIDRAYTRFYEGGFRATGVDSVMADTGISKRTLYKYFPSKEDLIQAVLEKYGDGIECNLFGPARERAADPKGQIEAIFDVRREMMVQGGFQGCLAMKAAQEYMGKHEGIEAFGKTSGLFVEDRFAALCEQAGLPDAKDLGQQIAIVFQGAVMSAQIRRDTAPFDAAKKTLKALLVN